jgi:Uma2 family endonuclease
MTVAYDTPVYIDRLVLTGVSWAYYEHTLKEIGNRPIRISFLDGTIEIMSPLPEHENVKRAIGRLIEHLTFERGLPCKSFGSTTFRREDRGAGVEPDKSYYFHNIEIVAGMKRFDPAIHPVPDLAVEVDIFSSSVPREQIYVRLGISEIWRYDGEHLRVRLLAEGGYVDSASSRLFPFLPMADLPPFITRMVEEDENQVLRGFAKWLKTLPAT